MAGRRPTPRRRPGATSRTGHALRPHRTAADASPRGRLRRADDGLSLIEVLIALVVAGIVAAALAATLITALRAAHTNELRTEAAQMANAIVEEQVDQREWHELAVTDIDDTCYGNGRIVTDDTYGIPHERSLDPPLSTTRMWVVELEEGEGIEFDPDADDGECPSATAVDDRIRLIRVEVEWQDARGTRTVDFETVRIKAVPPATGGDDD